MLRSRTSFDRDSTFRRARPLLGTMVEITLCHDDQAAARVACERAFQAVAAIDAFMSYHRRESELSRLNGTPPGVPCDVSLHTWRVLTRAASVHLASGGLFDCTVAPCLEDQGFLPRWTEACDRDGTQDDVLLPAPGRVV